MVGLNHERDRLFVLEKPEEDELVGLPLRVSGKENSFRKGFVSIRLPVIVEALNEAGRHARADYLDTVSKSESWREAKDVLMRFDLEEGRLEELPAQQE